MEEITMGCILKGLGVVLGLLILAWLLGLFFGQIPSIGNLIDWRVPAAQAPGGTTQSSSATAEPEATPDGGVKTLCEVMAFAENWVVLRPEDSINTTLVVLDLDDKSHVFVPYIGMGTGTVLAEILPKKNLMGVIHFSGGQYGTVLIYDLVGRQTLDRKEVNRDEVDAADFAENGLTLLFDTEEQELRINAPELTAAQRAKYDIQIRVSATPLGRITAEAEAAIRRVQLQNGSFCKLP